LYVGSGSGVYASDGAFRNIRFYEEYSDTPLYPEGVTPSLEIEEMERLDELTDIVAVTAGRYMGPQLQDDFFLRLDDTE